MALSSRGHSMNHCEPISCKCSSRSFSGESLDGIRYPLMEGNGAVCRGPMTRRIQVYEVKSTHYKSRSPEQHIRSRLKLAVTFILWASGMEAEGCWLLESCFSWDWRPFTDRPPVYSKASGHLIFLGPWNAHVGLTKCGPVNLYYANFS